MSEIIVCLPPGIYSLDPELAQSIARDLGARLVITDEIVSTPIEWPMRCITRTREELIRDYGFAVEGEGISNRASRRSAKFARRTNNEGWRK